ncbi:Protein-S-isoprenylcysteine O-methyltransferase [Mycena chlorophos]|uniref:Protein-S-isoprenylcysteine O-methyltransferase n=1 Tax=Mycena chlorophos TaxID=658473 RepID=A0A8H6SFX4_MYCCL|nr:Protein-S-isoprenylcysteine O-methyltransferase [Mycena chlorophos]
MTSQWALPLLLAAGLASWGFFHVVPTRGDRAFLAYVLIAVAFYIQSLRNGTERPATFTALVAAEYAVSTLLFTILYRLSPWHRLAGFPGPLWLRFSALPRVILTFTGKRHIILDNLHEKYGDFVRIGPDVLSIRRRAANSVVYGSSMDKPESYATPGHLPSNSLFFKPPSREWHANRKKIWAPAFAAAASSSSWYIPVLERRAWDFLHCVEMRQSRSPDGFIDLSRALGHWAYDFMSEMLFGGCGNLGLMHSDDPEDIVEGGKLAMALWDCLSPSPWLVDLAWHIPPGKNMVRLREDCAKKMVHRVESSDKVLVPDLASYWLNAEEHRPTLEDMKVDAVIAQQGGSDNTAITLSLAIFFLVTSEHGASIAKLRAELDEAFADPTGTLNLDVLGQLPFLNAVIQETLRLGTPFYLPRQVGPGGVMLDEKYIPEDVTVVQAAWSLQTSPEYFFPDPQLFRAERWLPEGLGPGSQIDKSVAYSFSNGAYMCVAKSFAYQELRFMLARLVLAFEFEMAPGFDAVRFRDGILNMRTTFLKHPLMVRARRRPGIVIPDAV